MTDALATIKKSFCSDSKCPKPTVLSKSSEISLGVGAQTSVEQDVFSSSVSLWLHSKAPTSCLRKHHPISPACKGSRSHSTRTFIQGMPMVLPFNVDILAKNGFIPDVNHLPDDIQINANEFITTYKLFGVTYGNGSHFKSAMHLPPIVVTQPGWHEYDGLWEHRQRGRT